MTKKEKRKKSKENAKLLSDFELLKPKMFS